MDLYLYDEDIRRWLREDLPYGDVSSDSLFPEGRTARAEIRAKDDGIVAGLPLAGRVFEVVSPQTAVRQKLTDGDRVQSGDLLMVVEGEVSALLKAERLALNLLGRLSGIATLTARFVKEAGRQSVRITDTRKTTPGLRSLEKYAVRMGGGINHRFDLSGAVMLKDNHIQAAGGILEAVHTVRRAVSHTMRIEVEVETLEQYREALQAGPDIVMLDNMSLEDMARAVREKPSGVLLEASGNVTLETVAEIAATGVDVISAGALTHSVPVFDVSMKLTGTPDREFKSS